MKIVASVSEAVNSTNIPRGSVIHLHGSAATPRILCAQLAADPSIQDVSLICCLPMGEIQPLFTEEVCRRITHRITFNTSLSREAQNRGWAEYQLMHLSDIPRQLRENLKPTVALCSVAGPDNGGNYSLGPMVVGAKAAMETVKKQGGIIIAERNRKTPFILGTTIHESDIDFLIDTDYELPINPANRPDDRSRRIGDIIGSLFVQDGSTLQYGIGEVPSAVTDAIIRKGVKNLGVHTELFTDSMRLLMEKGIVNNAHTTKKGVALASIFQCENQAGYDWLHFNSSIESRPSDFTNNVINIARQPKMLAVNSAIGVDLHGNIWADSLQAPRVYSGVGGQCDFIRGARLSPGGIPVIAMKSTTESGKSKILAKHPEGITTTAIAADPVVIVTEYGALDPCGLSYVEKVVGIAHLAAPDKRDELLRYVFEHPEFHNPREAIKEGRPKGFIPYEAAMGASV